MKEVTVQYVNGALMPYSAEDAETLKAFKPNQPLRAKLQGTTKGRSLEQLRLFWVCCQVVADNSDGEDFDNKDQVANYVKRKLLFYDKDKSIVYDGVTVIHWRSISFDNLAHMEACNFFDRAFPVLADLIGVTVDELLDNAEV